MKLAVVYFGLLIVFLALPLAFSGGSGYGSSSSSEEDEVDPKQEAYEAARAAGKVLKGLVERLVNQKRSEILDDPQSLHELATVVNHIEEGNQFGGWIPPDNRDAVTSAIETFRTNYAEYKKLDDAEG